MNEFIRGSLEERQQIHSAIQFHRERPTDYVQSTYPATNFVTLADLLNSSENRSAINPELFALGVKKLRNHLANFDVYDVLDPSRVWVGVGFSDANAFGGFHHYSNQGYRFVQKISILSIVGIGDTTIQIDPDLATLELLRAYIHDVMHYNSYRTFRAVPSDKQSQSANFTFYRFQYGINFRKWDGLSYSLRDPVKSTTTRNLGIIMEAAVDRFATNIVSNCTASLVSPATNHVVEWYIYRDCIGEITLNDVKQLRLLEQEHLDIDLNTRILDYLKNMRLFWRYVSLRYHNFLDEICPDRSTELQEVIIKCIITGKLRDFTQILNELLSSRNSFVELFKNSDYK